MVKELLKKLNDTLDNRFPGIGQIIYRIRSYANLLTLEERKRYNQGRQTTVADNVGQTVVDEPKQGIKSLETTLDEPEEIRYSIGEIVLVTNTYGVVCTELPIEVDGIPKYVVYTPSGLKRFSKKDIHKLKGVVIPKRDIKILEESFSEGNFASLRGVLEGYLKNSK